MLVGPTRLGGSCALSFLFVLTVSWGEISASGVAGAVSPRADLGVLTPSGPNLPQEWTTRFDSCDIVFHVHIPKTGGTAVVIWLQRGGVKLVGKGVGWESTRGLYAFHGDLLSWDLDLLKLARETRATGQQLVVTAETGLHDLRRHGYPWFNHTCFFATVREPHEWLLSAENHMRHAPFLMATDREHGGINGTWGYFDRPNLQSSMLGFRSIEPFGAVVVCASTIPGGVSFVNTLTKANLGELPQANVLPHDTNHSAELTSVVQEKYPQDLELWRLIQREGAACW